MASAGRDALTECEEIIKCVCTYRAHVDGCGADAGRVARTSHTPRDDGSTVRDDRSAVPDNGSAARRRLAARDNGSTVGDDKSATRDDGYGSLKKNR